MNKRYRPPLRNGFTTGGKFGGATAGVEIGGVGGPLTEPPVSTIGGSFNVNGSAVRQHFIHTLDISLQSGFF